MVSLQNLSSENSFTPGPLPKVYHVFSFQQCNRTKQFYNFLPASSLHQVSPADHRMATLTKKINSSTVAATNCRKIAQSYRGYFPHHSILGDLAATVFQILEGQPVAAKGLQFMSCLP